MLTGGFTCFIIDVVGFIYDVWVRSFNNSKFKSKIISWKLKETKNNGLKANL